MIYLQLQSPYRYYDKLEVTAVNFHENGKIVFGYKICSDDATLFDQLLSITDSDAVDVIKNASSAGMNSYDSICKALIEYVVSNDIEKGTIEVK